ncbi:MAG TPA: AbrB/MazE/SpoVT family DNA-binding domain-containing protein [Mycobacteriales bacterium]|jgi:AbrB family looped-hinge helix DNA binding protein|nr:AbrB/MazE/SpoVT family DNA-binding domain-containing protein [Mycobacteriales bacterium]
MQTTIDRAGRVVIPKRLRDRFGLRAGAAITIEDAGDHVEIRVSDVVAPQLVEEGGRLVFTTDTDAPTLTDEDIRQLIEEGRR